MTESTVEQVDPPELYRSPAFAQGMIAPEGPLLFVGGQNGVDAEGALLDGLQAQTEQALRNLLAVLAAAGSGPEQVVKLNIHLAPGIDPTAAYGATRTVWGTIAPRSPCSRSLRRARAPSSRSTPWRPCRADPPG
ncbi:RidA family protein [Leifsonia xyli]|uniref:RidA family protein n=1 Tax=Leifsonia xyli TaxID=1575 RepID=UPI003D667F76